MFDLQDRADAFATLAAELGVQADPLDDLGPIPGWLGRLFRDGSNGALGSGLERPAFDLNELRGATLAIPPDRWRDRADWWRWTSALAAAALDHPDFMDELRALMHAASSRPGAFTGAYPRDANDQEWSKALQGTRKAIANGKRVHGPGTLLHGARAHGWAPTAGQTVPATGSRRASELLARRRPYKRRPEHGGLFNMGELSLLNSPGGVGKTTYLVGVSLALASGLPLLGQEVFRRRKVLLISLEEQLDELLLKVGAAHRRHGSQVSLPPDVLEWISLCGAGELPGLTLVKALGGREVLNEAGLALLRQTIEEAGADIVIIDPVMMLFPAGMNDNGLVYQAALGIKKIAADLQCAILLAAHTKKGGNHGAHGVDGAEAILGAVALSNAARVVKGLGRPTPEACKAIGVPYGRERDVREIVDQKSNFSPADEGRYFILEPIQMNNAMPPDYPDGDWVAVAAEFTVSPGGRILPQGVVRAALVELARGVNGGAHPYGPSKQTAAKAQSRYYAPSVARAIANYFPGAHGHRLEQAAKEAFQEACDNGWLEIYDAKIGSNRRKGIRVRWSATPWRSEPPPSGAYVV